MCPINKINNKGSFKKGKKLRRRLEQIFFFLSILSQMILNVIDGPSCRPQTSLGDITNLPLYRTRTRSLKRDIGFCFYLYRFYLPLYYGHFCLFFYFGHKSLVFLTVTNKAPRRFGRTKANVYHVHNISNIYSHVKFTIYAFVVTKIASAV